MSLAQLTNFLDPTNFDAIGKASIGGTGLQERALMSSESYVDRAKLKADEMIQVAEFGGQALSAEGAAAGQSAMWSGLSSGIGSLAGGFAKRPGAGGGLNLDSITDFNNPTWNNARTEANSFFGSNMP